MIREKTQRNHKVEAHPIIFACWRKNERCMRNVANENGRRRSPDSIKRSVHLR